MQHRRLDDAHERLTQITPIDADLGADRRLRKELLEKLNAGWNNGNQCAPFACVANPEQDSLAWADRSAASRNLKTPRL